MDTRDAAPRRYNYFPVGLLGALLALTGWGGLLYLVATTYPNGQTAADLPLPEPSTGWTYLADLDSTTLAAFSVFLVIAVAGTSLPLTWFLNRRFSRDALPRPGTIIRQSLLVGLFVAVATWLRANHTFTVPLVFIAGGVLILVEVLMLFRQRGSAT